MDTVGPLGFDTVQVVLAGQPNVLQRDVRVRLAEAHLPRRYREIGMSGVDPRVENSHRDSRAGDAVVGCRVVDTEPGEDTIALADLKKLSSLFGVDVVNVFDVRRSLAARRSIGAPSPENVSAQIKRWRKQFRG